MSQWIEENYKEGLSFRLGLKQKLFSGQSAYQKVEVFESTHHGRVLLNDGAFMLSERDEAIYHEMMAHVPLFVHPNPRRVLVIGGGDGGTAREVLRHPQVEQCTLVEIDQMVVDACRQWIPQTAAVFSHPRLKLHIADGVEFVAKTQQQFDVVLIDSTDPVGPAQPLFGPEFYQNVKNCLAEDGIVVAQSESVFYEFAMQEKLMQITSEMFTWVSPYNFTNMTYPGGLWSLLWASKSLHPLRDLFEARVSPALAEKFFYYEPAIHRAAFVLPHFQKQRLGSWIKI